MPELHLHLLGDFRLTCGHAPVGHLDAPRLQALLAYLVLHRDAPQPRRHLAFRLWPDSREAQARTNLRQLVHSLRRALPDADRFVHAGAQTLRWRGDAPFRLDVAEFEGALARAAAAERRGDPRALRAALERAVAVYRGDLLPSCYDDWILPERERLRQAVTGALERLVLLLEAQGDPRAAITHAQRLLRHDPLREETYRALMRLHAACGDRAGALRVYHTCVAVLERELAVAPSAATQEAYGRVLRVGAPARPPLPPRPANTNLPVPLTGFVGREAALAEVGRLLGAARLVTLTGPGGCGKTRLALEAATNLLDRYPNGVWWADLAALADPLLVPQAVATALGVREQPGRPLPELLVEYLRAKQSLLLLDNCEHLVGACAQLAEHWLGACPDLHILATSREALRTGGEITWPVPSLGLPEAQPSPPVEELSRYEAIRLFVERAATVLPTFRLTAANGSTVAQICRRLDGLPLAIELAAARVRVLHVEQIAARLDDALRLLTAGRRTALPRHQTLRAALDWSHALLSDRERVLFRRLAVFTGGFTLEAAEAVCAGEGLEADGVLELLAHLVDKSLVAVTQEGATRYRVLETVRHYALGKLREAGEAQAARRRHGSFFLRLAEAAEPALTSAERGSWLARLEAEHDNLRASLGWSLERGETETALRLAGALSWFWRFQAHASEGRRWLEAALAQGSAGPAPEEARQRPPHPPSAAGRQPPERRLRAKALLGAGSLAIVQGDFAGARSRLEESVALWRELGEKRSLAHALSILGVMSGDPGAARAYGAESVALMRAVGNTWDLAWSLVFLGLATTRLGDAARAQPLYEESLALFRETGDKWASGLPLVGLGWVAFLLGDYAAAGAWFERAVSLGREQQDTWFTASSLLYLGHMVQLQGDNRRALALFRESLGLCGKVGDRRGVAESVVGCAMVAASQGNLFQAARLFAATEAPLAALQPLVASALRIWDRALAHIRAQLDADQFAAAWAGGRALTLEEAVAEALSVSARQ
jgi:predicted ATPase/DNA-binding SARP family transcriptional activator